MLEQFELKLIAKMLLSSVLPADAAGINSGAKNHRLHCLPNPQWTLYYAHAKRGSEAMAALNVLPRFTGMLCHDHWKPYFQLCCLHGLCNARHLRELTYVEEQDQQGWARPMRELLPGIEQAVKAQGGALPELQTIRYTEQYRAEDFWLLS